MKRLISVLAITIVSSSAATARADDADKDKPAPTGDATADAAKAAPPSGTDFATIAAHYPPPSTRLKLIGAGLFVTAAAWGLSFGISRGWQVEPCVITDAGSVYPNTIISCQSGPPGAAQLGIPIVGPWLALGKSGCPNSDPTNCSLADPVLRGIGYVLDGVAQFGGLALIAEALIMKTESAVDPTKKTSPLALRYGNFELVPTPIVAPTMSGLSISGTF